MESMLTPAEHRRYARHLILPELGEAGQQRLKAARVLVIGAGGLGSPLLQYLAAAGVGRLGIVDPDRVSLGNLQRQVLYDERDLGRPKVLAAADRLRAMNPLIEVATYEMAFDRSNALELVHPYDVVVDGTDNFPTRYLVNDACVLAGKVNVYGSVYRFEGQVSVFNLPLPDGGRGPNYRDLFPEPPPPDMVPSCAEGGVLGVLPGIIGTMQASETIKVLTGIGEPLSGRLFLFDAASFTSRLLKFSARSTTQVTELIDYEAFCGLPARESIPSLDYPSLSALLARGEDLQLIDVRRPDEHARANLGGLLLPLDQLTERISQLDPRRTTVVYCQSGQRSAQAARRLIDEFGFERVFHLEGGMEAISHE